MYEALNSLKNELQDQRSLLACSVHAGIMNVLSPSVMEILEKGVSSCV